MLMTSGLAGAEAATIASLVGDAAVGWEVLEARHHRLLQLVSRLLGVVPNCDRYLEIWPPAFRTYNVMVPNLLNLPVPVMGVGGPPPGVVGLAMYVASRTAECPYCSAHSCTFAMRRGASPEQVAAALVPERGSFDHGELAAIAVAKALARVPCELTVAEKDALIGVYGERRAEWIVLAVVMMGFLNKFMDGLGVELEQDVFDEVADTMGGGWSPGKAGGDLDTGSPRRTVPPVDGLRTRLGLLPLLPGAVRYDRRIQRGVPAGAPATASYLRERFGHEFPTLLPLRSNRARRAVAVMLRENLDPSTSVLGMETKLRAGAIFAEVVGDSALVADVQALARHFRVDLDVDGVPTGADDAALVLARAVSPTPAQVDGTTVEACRRAGASAPAIIELVSWLALLQLLHRLGCWIDPTADDEGNA